MTTELYARKHNDITLADEPKRLLVTVRNGKTGMRIANTLESAVAPYNPAYVSDIRMRAAKITYSCRTTRTERRRLASLRVSSMFCWTRLD
jgi:hypothetical protein